ncbi:MAG TPA: hypothetical protein VG247_24570 [Pseudonocardiaceae bacterium]|nr:hypothetical protein [Pseudonocardiaceae bacterium]
MRPATAGPIVVSIDVRQIVHRYHCVAGSTITPRTESIVHARHAGMEITMQTYAHANMAAMRDATRQLSEQFL